jgi:SAM-dependent methyltransferase
MNALQAVDVVLPFSVACERNKQPILAMLRQWLPPRARVLEIGSGSGQHAVYFTQHLEDLYWQPSEQPSQLPGLAARIAWQRVPQQLPAADGWQPLAPGSALAEPITLDVDQGETWPNQAFDAVFSANTLHIMPAASMPQLLAGAARVLKGGGLLLLYGPFLEGDLPAVASNLSFDAHLRSLDPRMGLRDLLEIRMQAQGLGLEPLADLAMPAHNRTLVFRRIGGQNPLPTWGDQRN